MPVDNFPTDLSNPVFPDVAVDSTTPYGDNHDITDIESGQPNVSVLSGPISLGGWPGNGIPLFSDFNKLFRLITQWIRWFWLKSWHEASVVDCGGTLGVTAGQYAPQFSYPAGFTAANCVIVCADFSVSTYQSGQRTQIPCAENQGSPTNLNVVFLALGGLYVTVYQRTSNVSNNSSYFDFANATFKILLKKIS